MFAASKTAGAVSAEVNYIESCFSTYLYTGTGVADNKITNNIDLAGKGGMVWLKSRSGAYNNYLTTNATTTSSGGGTTWLYSNTTDDLLGATGTGLCNFFSDGFDINPTGVGINGSGQIYASWTFRKQPKFFDVVTYTGTGSVQNIAHNLGSTPGCIIVKSLTYADYWVVYHRGANGGVNPEQYGFYLNDTSSQFSGSVIWNNTAPTSTQFTLGTYARNNTAGQTYVAYLFAHNAGGFGTSGTDNVISCGSFTTDSIGKATVTLGYEPQFAIIKGSSAVTNWYTTDSMRGWANLGDTTGSATILQPNTSDAEYANNLICYPTATGFFANMAGNTTYIYIAIRRGPMKVPTSGTSVFVPSAVSTDINPISTGFPVDMFMEAARAGNSINTQVGSRLTGNQMLQTASTAAEVGRPPAFWSQSNTSYTPYIFETSVVAYAFRRAPSFFDEVCYTGNNTAGTTITHNLGVAPELTILKSRNEAQAWNVFSSFGSTSCLFTNLDTTNAATTSTYGSGSGFEPLSAAPTASVLNISSANQLNKTGRTYVAYLFASCPGVSKVGSYTGNGTTQTINCGFTGGARFVLIKKTSGTGSWYVWDSARGIVSGNDPYLLLNSTAAEVTSTDYIDTYSAGFEISSTAPAAINASGGTFIFLAIA